MQEPFALNVWLSSIKLITENQTQVLAKSTFWQQHNSQYILQIYSMTEWHSEIIPQHLTGRFLVQIPLMRSARLWDSTSLQGSR